jgi:predicted RNA-binding protein associated with RNAse of E/G family
MHRLYANRPDWKRVPNKRFYCKQIDTPSFVGSIILLLLDEVREPLIVDMGGQSLCLADTGYSWLQQFPANAHYTITTMYDANAKIVQWYIDICLQTGVDERNIPWLDDLYLDLVVYPTGEVFLLDADELADALEKGEISAAEYDMAWREVNQLKARIAQGNLKLAELSARHRKMLLETKESSETS